MSNESNIRHSKHYIFKLHVYWVFVAKYRRRVFNAQAIDLLRSIFANVCSHVHATMVQMDGEDDHVHLLVQYPPKVAVSALVNSLEGISSRLLCRERPDIRKRYWKGVLWSPSYFASSCGGAPISIVRQYIEQQTRRIDIHDSFAVGAILPQWDGRPHPLTASVCQSASV
jgi:putative transposase